MLLGLLERLETAIFAPSSVLNVAVRTFLSS